MYNKMNDFLVYICLSIGIFINLNVYIVICIFICFVFHACHERFYSVSFTRCYEITTIIFLINRWRTKIARR